MNIRAKLLSSKLSKIKILVLLGYLYSTNRAFLFENIDYVIEKFYLSKSFLWCDLLLACYRYRLRPEQYFLYRIFEKKKSERSEYISNLDHLEYTRMANKNILLLDNKLQFLQAYKEFVPHDVFSLEELSKNKTQLESLLRENSKLVLKIVSGTAVGHGVEVIETNNFDTKSLLSYMQEKNYGMLEVFLKQHPDLEKLSPAAVNTARVITQINLDGEPEILACRARISVDKPVDNFGQGGLAAIIDVQTGKIITPAIFNDLTKGEIVNHPVTGVDILGFQFPFWDQVVPMVKAAASKHPENKSIGWDVVFTEDKVGLLEGNHNWCKDLFQAPAKKGLKSLLINYPD